MKIKVALMLAALVCPGARARAEEISLESAPPVVIKTIPMAGAVNVDPSLAKIQVTFSKPMQDGSWSWSTWGEENFPEMVGRPKYLADGRTCVLTVKLEPDKFYATWINSEKFRNFKDTGGRPAVPYLLTFRTSDGSSQGRGGKTRAFEYYVKSGDTLSEIARKFRDMGSSATIEDLLSANPGLNPEKLTAGQKIYVPAVPARTAEAADTIDHSIQLLNGDQLAVLAWTERQFRSFFDARTFDGWSAADLKNLESKSIDALKGPRSREYYQAINTLAALHATNALPQLRHIAFERVDKDNRDRWMAVRAIGIIGDRRAVPEMIPLVYHGNVNTRWWAQISLVRLTGQNFGSDWNAWGEWWNRQGGQPVYNPEIIRWWTGQVEPERLAESLADGDRKFIAQVKASAE